VASETASGDDHVLNTQWQRTRSKSATVVGERVVMSDDDGEAVYEKFRNRKKKRATPTTRKAKSSGVVGTGVGKRKAKSGTKSSAKKAKVFGDDSDDALMEDTLPDYLQARRRGFETDRERLKEAGLKLPPDFDDIDFSDDDRLADLKERPNFPTKPPAKYKDIALPYSLGLIPAPIAQWLRDYQVKGVAFLHELFVYQKGGILGDDMGLGKTVQVIAFLTAAFGKTGDERDAKRMRKMRRARDGRWYPRALVICPGSLIENWKSEFQRWGWWQIDVFHADEKETALQAAKSGRLEIMITTYATYRLNKGVINMVEWDCVIADECHIIKERHSGITKAMNEINALCRIGLSGTAIQNKYEELWTLLNWTNPGRFGPISTWKSSISEPLKVGQSHDATVYQLRLARSTAKKLVENLLPEFFLRRMKTLIADQLPKKSDKVVFCPLTETQRDAYELFVDSDIVQYIKTAGEFCDCGSKKKRGWCCFAVLPSSGKRWQEFVFPAISNLQKLSNHLAILIPQGTDLPEKQAKDLEMLQIVLPDRWRELYSNRDSIVNFSNPEFCGKWKILKKLLKFWHSNGDKVLVFSHSVRLLKMLQMLFNHTSYNVSYLDGAMNYEDRSKTVDDFNSDPDQFVFLISTKAGGVGLNITSANKVVIVDPNWNPSYDLQAQDRAYRIGQIRDVEVFRLVSAGTIEEIVYARQIYKQQQANIGYNASTERRYFKGVQEKKDQKGEIFGLSNLFSYQGDSVVLRDIVNKTNVAESKAGVDVIQVDMDQAFSDDEDLLDGDEEDKAMSQLAALVMKGETLTAKGPSKKTDAVQAILAGAGVEYTHENSEVIGSSRVEAQLSKRAENAGNDKEMGDEKVFGRSRSDEEPDESSLRYGNGHVKLLYHPPHSVRKRQFCTMAKMFGFENVTEFALVVEGWTQEQRRNCLDKFYQMRRERLLEMEKGEVRANEAPADTGEDTADADASTVDEDEGVADAGESTADEGEGMANAGERTADEETIGEIDLDEV
jgi:DNA excision repair protein ERCC-6-like 2